MYPPLLLHDLQQMLQENDTEGLSEFCKVLHPAVAAEVLEWIDTDDSWKVLENCNLERQVEIIEFVSLPRRVELVHSLDNEKLPHLIEQMSADNRVDLLARMEPDEVEKLLPLIAQAERRDIRKLLSFPDQSAGSIMTTDYASLPENIMVREAIEQLRLQAPDRETIYYVYILTEGRRLDGLISLRELILAKPTALLSEIMERGVISVRVEDDQELVAQKLARYNFIAIPVVDQQNRLVGIVTHDDILDVVQEEANEDAYRLGAIEPLEDSYLETSFRTMTWKRGIWLLFLAAVSLVTAEILKHYKSVSETYDWMIWFLPLVLASGGNAGSQSATLIIRALALKSFSPKESINMAQRELLIGVSLGLCLAGLSLAVTKLLFGLTMVQLTIVSLTVFLVVVLGTVSGALLPLLFKRLGMDPALMSTPLIAAIVDVMGVVIYYSVALVALKGATSG